MANLYFRVLLPRYSGLECLCSVADPGGHCLREQAYVHCNFFFVTACVVFLSPLLSWLNRLGLEMNTIHEVHMKCVPFLLQFYLWNSGTVHMFES